MTKSLRSLRRMSRKKDGSGKKRTVDIREVLNAIFYRTRTGCQWRMLPSEMIFARK